MSLEMRAKPVQLNDETFAQLALQLAMFFPNDAHNLPRDTPVLEMAQDYFAQHRIYSVQLIHRRPVRVLYAAHDVTSGRVAVLTKHLEAFNGMVECDPPPPLATPETAQTYGLYCDAFTRDAPFWQLPIERFEDIPFFTERDTATEKDISLLRTQIASLIHPMDTEPVPDGHLVRWWILENQRLACRSLHITFDGMVMRHEQTIRDTLPVPSGRHWRMVDGRHVPAEWGEEAHRDTQEIQNRLQRLVTEARKHARGEEAPPHSACPDVLVHRVASLAEARALQTIGVRRIGLCLRDDPEVADGRALTLEEATEIARALRDTHLYVECTPEQSGHLPEVMQHATVLWSADESSQRTLRAAEADARTVLSGPMPLTRYFDLIPFSDASAPVTWEYQLHGGEPNALNRTTPALLQRVEEFHRQQRIYLGVDLNAANAAQACMAIGTTAHILTLGHPRLPPAKRHHQSAGEVFDTLAALGFDAIADTTLSSLEVADIARRQHGRLQYCKAEALAAGKEPFDLTRFAALYDISMDNTAHLSPSDQAYRWEERYFMLGKSTQTMEEFAAFYRTIEPYR